MAQTREARRLRTRLSLSIELACRKPERALLSPSPWCHPTEECPGVTLTITLVPQLALV